MILVRLLLSIQTLWAFTLTQENIKGFLEEPLQVHLNSGCPDGVSSELDNAIEFWNGAPHSGLVLERGGDVSYSAAVATSGAFQESIVVHCSTNFAADSGGADADSILGFGISDDFSNNGHLDKGVLVINTQAGAGASFQNSSGGTRKLTVVHEMGHVLGLGHSSVAGAIMFASTNGKEDVHLHQDDIDGIRHLYAQNELAGDYLFGCAMVSFNSAPPTFPPGAAILLLLLPLVACLGLRQRSLYFKASSKYF